jgi:hypothetical protein
MKLAEFITETLGEIMQGVSAAIKAHNVAALGGVINPRSAAEESDPKTGNRAAGALRWLRRRYRKILRRKPSMRPG